MDFKYSMGVPEGLEKQIAEYKFMSGTNITAEEIRKSVKGFLPVKCWNFEIFADKYKIEEVEGEFSNKLYLFFDKKEQNDAVRIHVNQQYRFIIPLERGNYGFSPEQIVKIQPARLDLELSKSANEVYERILNSSEMNANELFENIGYIINHSMLYDFNEVFMPGEDRNKSASKWNDIKKDYEPNGEEVISGICVDAGRMIREVLYSLKMEENFVYTAVPSNNGITSHDTTTVINKSNGAWAVINSKSPTKKYNLTPKERLVDLGEPYVR